MDLKAFSKQIGGVSYRFRLLVTCTVFNEAYVSAALHCVVFKMMRLFCCTLVPTHAGQEDGNVVHARRTTAMDPSESSIEVDLSHLPTDQYCAVCHNLDTRDHGPEPRVRNLNHGDWSGEWYADPQYHNEPFRWRSFIIYRLDEFYKTRDNCRGCALISAGISRLHSQVASASTFDFVFCISVMIWRGQNTTITVASKNDTRESFQICPGTTDKSVFVAPTDSFGTEGVVAHDVPLCCGSESLSFLKEQLFSCVEKHGTVCAKAISPRLMPRYLLHIGASDAEMRLVQVDTSGDVSWWEQRYAALSYCWGGTTQLRHLTGNSSELQVNVPHQKLGRLCQDAVRVCRDLGVQYLWVDALCIIQDDSQFWATESQNMAAIYENSFLVIAATRAPDPSHAIVGGEARNDPRQSFRVKLRLYDGSISNSKVRALDSEHHPKECPGPLSTRGWTFQERLMARRIVQFTAHELIWQCSTTVSCECHPGGLKPIRYRAALADWRHELWYSNIETYSRRQLTHFSDRLPAISGIACLRSLALNEKYLAGLWLSTVHVDMLWRAQSNEPPAKRFAPEGRSRGGPSWSWASVTGEILMERNPSARSQVVLDKVSCVPSTSNLFGPVSEDSQLEFQAKMITMDMKHVDSDGANGRRIPQLMCLTFPRATSIMALVISDTVLVQDSTPNTSFWTRATTAQEAEAECSNVNRQICQVQCMLWSSGETRTYFLVLGGPRSHHGLYQRLGIIHFEHQWPSWKVFSAALEQEQPQRILLV